MALQFLHFNLVSRVPPKKAQTKHWTVSETLKEAARHPGDAPHVPNPQVPIYVRGDDLAQLERTILARAEQAKDASGRRLRKDSPVLLAGVASYPVPVANMTAAQRCEYEVWESRVVNWLKGHFGENLTTVVRHEDESHPHVHFFVIPPLREGSRLDISAVHRGVAAREACKRNGGSTKDGNREYCAAMRQVQSEFHSAVGIYHGHLRDGPRRKRLSRGAYLSEKYEAKQRAELMKRIEVDMVELEELRIAKVHADHSKNRANLLERERDQLKAHAEDLQRSLFLTRRALETERQSKLKFKALAEHSGQVIVNLIGVLAIGQKRFRHFLLNADSPGYVHPKIWSRLRSFLSGGGQPGGMDSVELGPRRLTGRERGPHRHDDWMK